MTNNPRYASLYQINTRVWLTELSHALGRAATLDDIPDAELDRIAALGFDWMWFLSVWQTGPGGAARGAADIQSLADLTNSFEWCGRCKSRRLQKTLYFAWLLRRSPLLCRWHSPGCPWKSC